MRATSRGKTYNSLAYHLLARPAATWTSLWSSTGDQTNVVAAGLGPPANNGGTTLTHALRRSARRSP
jgi:hypothetical protein